MSVQEVRKLTKSLFESSGSAPKDFQELMQMLFSSTIISPGQALISIQKNDLYTIQGRPQKPIFRLNDGRYLRFFIEFRFHRKGTPLSVTQAAFQYQSDDAAFSDNFVFRYDYSTEPADGHPASHLQLNGALNAAPKVELEKVRFPVNRPSVESMLRLLIHDFGVKANDPRWSEILQASETAFLDYQAKKRMEQLEQ